MIRTNISTEHSTTPTTFRLPKKGVDPYFGFTRMYYYRGEELGYWKLLRIRPPGKDRGVTLVRYAAILDFLDRQSKTDASRRAA